MQNSHVSSTVLPRRIAEGHVVAPHWIFRQDIRLVGPTASNFDLTKGQMDKNVPLQPRASKVHSFHIFVMQFYLKSLSFLVHFHLFITPNRENKQIIQFSSANKSADIVNGIEIIFESPGAGLR
ncbi:hypothetical protein V6N11_073488 [Hibiscus sabdariffa]|uniref:Uncharacterized protein n=2 Tax=Hibiscus sabdariffa TaxID=183260 RepID=A0ABR2BLF2_9ROSI